MNRRVIYEWTCWVCTSQCLLVERPEPRQRGRRMVLVCPSCGMSDGRTGPMPDGMFWSCVAGNQSPAALRSHGH
jgi:hypothetical protein